MFPVVAMVENASDPMFADVNQVMVDLVVIHVSFLFLFCLILFCFIQAMNNLVNIIHKNKRGMNQGRTVTLAV